MKEEEFKLNFQSRARARNFFKRINGKKKSEIDWVDNPTMSEAEFQLRIKMNDYFLTYGFYDMLDLLKLQELKGGKIENE